MPTSVLISQSAADGLCCLGLGLLLAAMYDVTRLVLGNARWTVFFLDCLFLTLAGVLACSYAASRSYAGVVRWYHLVGMFAGQWAYYKVFCPVTQMARNTMIKLLLLPFAVLYRVLICRIFEKIKNKICKMLQNRKNRQKNIADNATKQLQSSMKMLYNSK